MKSILIKSGKAYDALRKEGLVRGGKRVAKSFLAQFGRVRPGDILFVTSGVGDSARYRAHNQAEELRYHDFKCSVTIQENPFLASYSDKFSIFIFHRVRFTSKIAKLITNAKKLGREIIFETDDLVFEPELMESSAHFKKMNAFEKKQYAGGVGGEFLKDPDVKTCVTSTDYLARVLEKHGKKVFVSKNKLSLEDLRIADDILGSGASKSEKGLKIGYFAGTKGHDKNFATIKEVLIKILEKYPSVKLLVAGPLKLDEKFKKYENQLIKRKFAPRKEHFKNISDVDINIIPLVMNDPFCEAKSELKFFEAGIMRVPSVAVNSQTYKEAIEDGHDGYLAGSFEEWFSKIEELILYSEQRLRMGKNAREKALSEYSTKNSHNAEYYEFLRSHI